MSYEIIWDEKARDFLRKIPQEDAQRIIKKVNSIVDYPQHYVESLVEIDAYKLRIGDFRALIGLSENNKTISVLFIGNRKDIYKYLQRSGLLRK